MKYTKHICAPHSCYLWVSLLSSYVAFHPAKFFNCSDSSGFICKFIIRDGYWDLISAQTSKEVLRPFLVTKGKRRLQLGVNTKYKGRRAYGKDNIYIHTNTVLFKVQAFSFKVKRLPGTDLCSFS